MVTPSKNKRGKLLLGIVAAGIGAALALESMRSTPARAANEAAPSQPAALRVEGGTPEQVGRYLVLAGGCNDCHTPNFMQQGTNVPESEWLTGLPVGFSGPWGTTYGSNLRLFVKDFDEDMWVAVVRARSNRPPMPWTSLHALSDADLKAVFHYIKSLKPLGNPAPAYAPPTQKPQTPVIMMVPQVFGEPPK